MSTITPRIPHPEDAEIAEIGQQITALHQRRLTLMETVAFREMIQREAAALLVRQGHQPPSQKPLGSTDSGHSMTFRPDTSL